MKRESVLSDIEKESIVIEKLIFHIIVEESLKPVYLDEVILTEEQKSFFRNRLIEVSQGNQYVFIDKTTSKVYEECKKIIEDIEINFLQSSKVLTSLFKSQHKKSMSDGVFVIAVVTISMSKKLIFMLKIDHKLVYQYKKDKNKATLKKILNTFIEDKKAIQKVALIDMSDTYSWDLLASERDSDGIRQYFKNFLLVNDKDDAYSLTDKMKGIVRLWAKENDSLLYPEDNIVNYKSRAINYLLSHIVFDSDEFIDSVIFDTDEIRRDSAKKSFKSFMQDKGLYGQKFKPSQKALTAAKRKNKGKTAEGIILQWDGDAQDVNLIIPKERSSDDLFHIIIKTSGLSFID